MFSPKKHLKLIYKILTTSIIRLPIINYFYNYFHWKRYNNDFSNEIGKFNAVSDILRSKGGNHEDKIIIEIGAGNQIGFGLCFLMNNCKKYIFLDKFQCFFNTKNELNHIKNMLAFIEKHFKKKFSRNFVRFNEDTFFFDKEKVSFMTCEAENIDLPDNSVDIIISTLVLEHLRNLDQTFKEFHRVLKKQGVMFHSVDLGNHKDFNNPFDILKYSDFFWETFLCAPETYQNRARASYYEKLCKINNFKIILFRGTNNTNVKFDRKIHPLNKRFVSLDDDDLNILRLKMICLKS